MTLPKPTPERYVVVLEAMPSEAPAINRLRSFLKCALRSYRLKAVKITTETPSGIDANQPPRTV